MEKERRDCRKGEKKKRKEGGHYSEYTPDYKHFLMKAEETNVLNILRNEGEVFKNRKGEKEREREGDKSGNTFFVSIYSSGVYFHFFASLSFSLILLPTFFPLNENELNEKRKNRKEKLSM